jgi:3-oxoadipate enol-lactonase
MPPLPRRVRRTVRAARPVLTAARNPIAVVRPPAHEVPEPPVPLPEGRIVRVAGRGEFFVRDTGGDGPTVLLLHGWAVPSDLNWAGVYRPLARAGYRVLAMDHRGHGRGLRSPAPFRLSDCAADAAGVLEALDAGPALAVGYSMGGPVAQLMARDSRDLVRGIVLCATATNWRDPRLAVLWRSMAAARLTLGLFPMAFWQAMVFLGGMPEGPTRAWVTSELGRGSARDIAEAGRELARYDSREWVGGLDVPAAVLVTTRDSAVPPDRQRELARLLGVDPFDVPGEHGVAVAHPRRFTRVLLEALEQLSAGSAAGSPQRRPRSAGRKRSAGAG